MSKHQEEIKEENERNLQYRVGHALAEELLRTLSFLQLAGDERTKRLQQIVSAAYSEVKRLKERKFAHSKKMNPATRESMEKELAQCMRDGMFGDGMEDEYVWYGAAIDGVLELDDEELIAEYERYSMYEEDDKLIKTAKLELEINKEIGVDE